ncbi:MAG: outer membrane protein transport protein [Candidatus Aminicenantes bacterium]|jgi:long-subunit fatty acid transport protein
MRIPRLGLFVFFSLTLAFLPKMASSQMIVGQYEDEAPLRTWNSFGFQTAPSLAMGETQYTMATDSAVSLSNPALLAALPRFSFTLNSSLHSASLYKYSAINTGPFYSDENSILSIISFDFAGASIRIKNWTFALSMALLESYARPSAEVTYSTYTFTLEQSGNLKNINFSVARKVLNKLSVGIGLNYAYGYLEKEMVDERETSNITQTDWKHHDFRAFYINGGLVLEMTRKIKVAAVFRTPFVKKSDSESLYRFHSPITEIRTEASEESEYKQPFVAGLGVFFQYSPKLKASSDFTFYRWSRYSIIYFGEEGEQERDFRDIIKIGAGVEYMNSMRLFGAEMNVPFRAGFSYDPQPMVEHSSSYAYFTFGTGLHWGKFSLDAGMLLGKERGSGNSLSGKKFTLSLSFRM